MIHKKQTAFTLVELIVVAAIIAILGTIGFVSFSESIPDARDTQRKSDMATITSSLKLYKQNKGSYPFPGSKFDLELGTGNRVAYQGLLDTTVSLTTLSEIPLDPELEIPYLYSVTQNRNEFQVAGTLENREENIALLKGDYRSVSRLRLPTIMAAQQSLADMSTTGGANSFIFDGGRHNLPYDFQGSIEPVSDGTTFNNLIADPAITFWDKNDFRTCAEILASGKAIGNGQYQLLNGSGALTDTVCPN